MFPDEERRPSTQEEPSRKPATRSRRGRRGGRGRSRRPHSPPQRPPEADQIQEDQPKPQTSGAREPVRPVSTEARSGSAIGQAVAQVNGIIELLRRALDEMEEVLETVELAERQKIEDEREIESLRRALRQLHRPREGEQAH